MKKNQKGFTLVEVIVVAVIVAILAAVAVPIYVNYVTSSRTNSAANAGGAIAAFLGACRNTGDGVSAGYTSGTAITTGGTITCASTAMGNTSSLVPTDIDVTITGSDAAGGTVTAVHADGGNTSSFTY